MHEVSVIIPARDAAATIGRTLAALAAQDLGRPFEVIVVDDGSGDATAAVAAAAELDATVIHAPRQGPGPARNSGVERSRSSALAFTDADCFPHPSWLRQGLEALAGAELVQGAVRPDPAAARKPFDRTISVAREYGLYETANMFATRALFDRLGGFEDPVGVSAGKPLGEDVWFGWRARRAGAVTAFSEQAIVDHAVFARSALAFVGERSRLRYFPAMVARMPELRDTFLFRRYFLSRRSAQLDLALSGVAVGLAMVLAGGPTAVAVIAALAAAVPYARTSWRAARPWGRRAPVVALTELAADLVGFASLIAGTARWRAPVL